MPQSTFARLRGALLGAVVVLASIPASAFLSDDEARRAIIELRSRVETNRQAAEEANQRLDQTLRQLLDEQATPARRGLLDLINQIEGLRAELATLRGQNEQLARDVSELQRQQKDVLSALDERLRALEPSEVTLDGVEFMASKAEKSEYEAAMAVLRESQFRRAAALFGQFVQRHPASGYVPMALYWQGNALYAARDYLPAIESYRAMMAVSPTHPRVPESMLAVANCQLELKDARAAKVTLEALVKQHPGTEAGATARDRLTRMR